MTYATTESRTAELASDFGMEMLRAKFSETQVATILDHVGTFSRGSNAGKPKGQIAWQKVTSGGWGLLQPFPYANHYSNTKGVIYKGTRAWCILVNGVIAFEATEMAQQDAVIDARCAKETFVDSIKGLTVEALRELRKSFERGSMEHDQICLTIQRLTWSEED